MKAVFNHESYFLLHFWTMTESLRKSIAFLPAVVYNKRTYFEWKCVWRNLYDLYKMRN